ncbi:MAG: hypothetical protein K9M51_02260 [Candidatus Gracilibacteria bacterium]|nr:hypothetical protein [Candidatus Gracilibacteria bacterium]
MKKICAVSGAEFEITETDLQFYQKMGVPPPTLCPDERMRRRLAHRNERNFFRRKCDLCHQDIIAIYPDDVPFPVYCPTCWWSDGWDRFAHGQEFDFSRSFFPQFQELQQKVPRISMVLVNAENSQFCNFTGDLKNCYLCFGSIFCEDCLYGNPYYSKSCLDILVSRDCELAYDCVDSSGLYQVAFCQNSKNCSDSWFLKDCIGCDHCFGCVNLRHKSYYFLNQQCSKQEWEQKIEALGLGRFSQIQKLKQSFSDFVTQFPQRFAYLVQCERCTGDHLVNCKNTHDSYFSKNLEGCAHMVQTIDMQHSYDVNYMENCEWIVDSFGAYRNHNLRFGNTVYESSDADYCDFCVNNIRDCFGCIGLKHAQYCIFNKQYSQKEFVALRKKIIAHMQETGEWGEFFPIELSPFPYNESVSFEYFPLPKEDVLARGWRWRDKDQKKFLPATLSVIPDDIRDVDQNICSEVLSCHQCQKNYKIQTFELAFYQKMNLPIPRFCPDCRHADRLALRNPRKLFSCTCDCCSAPIQTTFAPERPEKVFCEKCYQNAVN